MNFFKGTEGLERGLECCSESEHGFDRIWYFDLNANVHMLLVLCGLPASNR
jgi:hypothetical protein